MPVQRGHLNFPAIYASSLLQSKLNNEE